MKELVLEQKRRVDEGRKDNRMPFRPDHGRLAELWGLELGVRQSLGV